MAYIYVMWPKVLVFLVACASSYAADANQDFIFLCDTHLQLGASRGTVLKAISKTCQAREIMPGETTLSAWIVSSTDEPKNDLGSVAFRNEKLVSICKYWLEGDTVGDLSETIYFVFKHFEEENRKVCVIETRTREAPRIAIRNVILRCGGKEIVISSSSAKGENSVMLNEILEEKREDH